MLEAASVGECLAPTLAATIAWLERLAAAAASGRKENSGRAPAGGSGDTAARAWPALKSALSHLRRSGNQSGGAAGCLTLLREWILLRLLLILLASRDLLVLPPLVLEDATKQLDCRRWTVLLSTVIDDVAVRTNLRGHFRGEGG